MTDSREEQIYTLPYTRDCQVANIIIFLYVYIKILALKTACSLRDHFVCHEVTKSSDVSGA